MYVRLLSACLCFLLLGLALHAETFVNPRRVPLSSDPSFVLVGDLNGDGVPDILYSSNTITGSLLHTLLADPAGSYFAGVDIQLPAGIISRCLLADLNADSALDLVCVGNYETRMVAVLLGRGDGTFSAPQLTTLPSAFQLNGATPAVAGDLNHDGHLDVILTGGPYGYTNLPLLGDGTGNLTPAPTFLNNYGGTLAQLVDLNGDGNLDLILQGGLEYKVTVSLGHGDGTFDNEVPYPSNSGAVLNDIDRDGHPDLIGGNNGVLQIFHGNPDGTFAAAPMVSIDFTGGQFLKAGFGSLIRTYASLDLNGDGIPDVLNAGDDGLTVLLGQPGLAFAPPLHYAVSQSFFSNFFSLGNALADLNGDGHLDFICVGPNGLYILYGKADGSFVSAPAYESGAIVGNATSADFNGDGNPDVITGGDSSLHLRLGLGDGTFAPTINLPGFSASTSDAQAEVSPQIFHGDFNGDGRQDLLIAAVSSTDNTSTSYIRLGHGDGTFGSPLVARNLVQNSAFAYVAAVADMNHDGRDDILCIDLYGLHVSLSNGDGTFRRFDTSLPDVNHPLTVADLDQDGILDVAYVDGSSITLLRGAGDGTFSPPTNLATLTPRDGVTLTQIAVLATGDFDGDGYVDVAALANYTTSPVTQRSSVIDIFFGRGHGEFTPATSAGVFDRDYAYLSAADLDGDGRADLVAAAPYYISSIYPLTTVHSLPGRTFGPPAEFTAGSGMSYLTIADLNRDGRPDILVANGDYNATANTFTVLLNQPDAPAVTGTLSASPEPSLVAQPFTITASFVAPANEPGAALNGTVSFLIDDVPLTTAPLTNNRASVPVPGTLSLGTHRLSAVPSSLSDGTQTYIPAALTATHVVTGLPVDLTLTATPNPADLGQQVTFSFAATNAASAPTGSPQPSGSISLSDGALSISVGSASGPSGLVFTAGHSFTTAGTHTILASYSGDALHSPASISITVEIARIATTTSITLSPNPTTYGQPVTSTAHVTPVGVSGITPTGSVLFTFCGGGTVSGMLDAAGTATVVDPAPGANAEPAGPCSAVASFPGDVNLLPSASPAFPYSIGQATSTTTLIASANPAYQGQTVSFDAQIADVISAPRPGATAPARLLLTGMVQLLEDNTVVASGTVLNGHVTLTTGALSVGTHTLTASYSGDMNLLPSRSAPFAETILSPGFTVALSAPALTIKGGKQASLTAILTSFGFSGPLDLTITGLPPSISASFTPAAVAMNSSSTGSASLTLNTAALPYKVLADRSPGQAPPASRRALASSSTPALLVALLVAPWLFRSRRNLPSLFLIILAAATIAGSVGCTTLIEQIQFTPGTYTATVIVTDPRSGVSQSTPLTLVVTP